MTIEITQAMREARQAVARVMELPPNQRQDYLETLGRAATKYMRALGGDYYVRGWLEAATAELDRPPMIELREPR